MNDNINKNDIIFPLLLNSTKFLCIEFSTRLQYLFTKSEPNINNTTKVNKILNLII